MKKDVKLEDLVGSHAFSGCDMEVVKIRHTFSSIDEDASAIRFRLDGKIYTAVEDPNDGYRSMMEKIFVDDKSTVKNKFKSIRVLARMKDRGDHGNDCDILQLIDTVNGNVILEVGTDNTDDYYPSFIAFFDPKKMAINEGKK